MFWILLLLLLLGPLLLTNGCCLALAITSSAASGNNNNNRMKNQNPPHDNDDPSDQHDSVVLHAKMQYVDAATNVAHIGRDTTGTDADGGIQDVIWKEQTVRIQNGRQNGNNNQRLNLMEHGVEMVPSPLINLNPNNNADNKDDSDIDFLDTRHVLERYYPLCEQLVRQCLEQHGDDKPAVVCAFDHNVRIMGEQGDSENHEKDIDNEPKVATKVQQPIMIVHGDYTAVSAPRRLEQLTQAPNANDVWKHDRRRRRPTSIRNDNSIDSVGSKIDNTNPGLLDPQMVQEAIANGRRFLFVNVWRNIDPTRPVVDYPLACIDATTVNRDEDEAVRNDKTNNHNNNPTDHPARDFRTLQIHYTDRIGENYLAVHHPRHRWVYFSNMTLHEAMLIKQWDSHGGLARGGKDDDKICTLCLHSAFDHDDGSVIPKRRKSIEVRCVVIY